MLNFYHKLNLNIYPIQNFDVTDVTDSHIKIDLRYLNPDLVNWLLTLDVYVAYMELYFKKKVTDKTQIHIDNESGDYVKINYIFGGKNSTMNWYKLKKNITVDKQIVKTAVNEECTHVFPFQVDVACQEYLTGLNLVQVGVPHDIFNPEEPRYCICCLLRDVHTNKRLSMADAENRFSKFILN